MPDGGRYEHIPRPQHIDYFQNVNERHNKVVKCTQLDEQSFEVERTRGNDLLVVLSNTYTIGIADYLNLIKKYPSVDVIVMTMSYNSYTKEAKEQSLNDGIGLFTQPEYMGAINYEGEKLYSYTPPTDEEKKRRKLIKF